MMVGSEDLQFVLASYNRGT